MHAKIHTATSVLCVHFQFSFHRDVEVTHMHEHPKKSFLFLVYFQNQKFFDHTSFSLSLWLLFLKKTNSRKKKKKKKKKKRGKKSFKFPVLPSLINYTHI